MPLGCDTATPITKSSLQTLISGGYTFVGRYLGSHLTSDEVKLITEGGLYIVSLYEKNPTKLSYFTAAQGQLDAIRAIKKAKDLGQPLRTPIYFTVDYDASPSDIRGGINTYLEAIRDEFKKEGNPYKLGLYGSGMVLKYFQNTYTYTWLAGAAAWRESKDYTGWSIKQYANGTTIRSGAGSIKIDKDQSNGAAGGWRLHHRSIWSLLLLALYNVIRPGNRQNNNRENTVNADVIL